MTNKALLVFWGRSDSIDFDHVAMMTRNASDMVAHWPNPKRRSFCIFVSSIINWREMSVRECSFSITLVNRNFSCIIILMDTRWVRQADVCNFNSHALLARSFHKYRLLPITKSIFFYPTEDVLSQFTPLRHSTNACIRYRHYFLSRYRSLSCGSVDAISIFCCIRYDDASLSCVPCRTKCRLNACVVQSPYLGWLVCVSSVRDTGSAHRRTCSCY